MTQRIKKLVSIILTTTLSLAIMQSADADSTDNRDPYQTFNRHTFDMNQKLDKVIFKPVATVYNVMIPMPVRMGVNSFFDNVGEVPTVANDLLQLKVGYAISDTCRFVVNSTLGFFGLFDIASHIGIPAHKEDFGMTLNAWGVKPSSYFVIPILGPSTIGDTVATPVNFYMTVWPYLTPVKTRNGLLGLDFLSTRAELLESDKTIQQASFDPYVFQRDAYLQHRAYEFQQNQRDMFPPTKK